MNNEEKNKIEKSTLYLVATPIGNLADISYRAVKILSEVDFIAAEDTRNTPKLLTHYGIKKPLISYYEHNKRERGPEIIERLKAGESCALVTDAGTPAISDPGADLVDLCRKNGVKVTSVPGACAAITALTLSGLDTRRFCFEGFLSTEKSEKTERLDELSREKRTVIIYEAPHKLTSTLCDLYKAFGNRKITVCRELTKINEEISYTTLSEAAAYYEEHQPRGEYVLVIEGAKEEDAAFFATMSVEEHVAFYEKQGLSRMDAIKAAAKDRGVPKSTLYAELNKG